MKKKKTLEKTTVKDYIYKCIQQILVLIYTLKKNNLLYQVSGFYTFNVFKKEHLLSLQAFSYTN